MQKTYSVDSIRRYGKQWMLSAWSNSNPEERMSFLTDECPLWVDSVLIDIFFLNQNGEAIDINS